MNESPTECALGRAERYRACLIKPMSSDSSLVRAEHVIDAALVGLLAFSAVMLVDVLPALASGSPVWLTPTDVVERVPTAVVAFLLTFAFQWARARGIDALDVLHRLLSND